MQNVLLVVELLVALALIGIVLLQRSEGAGGLGMSGGGNMSGRSPQTALGRLTWYLGILFFVVAFALTIVEAQNSGNSSVLDRLTDTPDTAPADGDGTIGLTPGEGLLPPPADGAPVTPPADDAPVTPPADTTGEAPAETAPAETAPAETAPAETAPSETAPATPPADN